MSADAASLLTRLVDPPVELEPLDEAHRVPLRAACAEDQEIWQLYPFSMLGGHFDPAFELALSNPRRRALAVSVGGVLIGTSSYLDISAADRTLEIGGTYLAPAARGTGVNDRMKRLMIDHALACGFHRIEFRVDVRNGRSMAAVLKLGATREGTLRRDRITWTGHVRDTAVFGLLAGEWAERG